MAFVEAHASPGSRLGAPPPRPNGILMEDGPFDITVRPGEHAIGHSGVYASRTRASVRQWRIALWTYRDALQPIAMGFRRFVTGSPGDILENLNVRIDIPLNQSVQVELIIRPVAYPARPMPTSPDLFFRLGLRYFDFRYDSPSDTHRFVMGALPDMRAFNDPEVAIYWEGEAEQSNPDLHIGYHGRYDRKRSQ